MSAKDPYSPEKPRAKSAGFLDRPVQQIFAGSAAASREAREGLQAQHA